MSLKNFFHRYKYIIFILLIMLLGGVLRFSALPDAFIRYSDEGVFFYEASWLLGDNYAPGLYEPLGSFKYFFIMLLAASIKFFGFYAHSAVFLNAFFGTATIFVVYLTGKKLFGVKTGLVAALVLALSKLHLSYSMNASSDAVMVFFFSLAMLFFSRAFRDGHWSDYLLAGMFSAFAFETKYMGIVSMFVLIVMLFLLFVIRNFYWKDAVSVKQLLLDSLFLAGGFLIIFFVFWGIFASLGFDYWFYILGSADQIDIGHKIIEAIPFLANYPSAAQPFVAGSSNILLNNLRYVFFIVKNYSFAILLFLVMGIYSCIKRLSRSDIFVLLWLGILGIIYIKIAYGFPRVLMPTTIIFALFAARGFGFLVNLLGRLSKRLSVNKKMLSSLLLVFIFLVSFVHVLDVVNYRLTAYENASEYMMSTGCSKTISNVPAIFSFYLHNDSKLPTDIGEMKNLYNQGYDCIVFDSWYDGRSSTEFNSAVYSLPVMKTFVYSLEPWNSGVGVKRKTDSLRGLPFVGNLFGRISDSIDTQDDEQKIKIFITDEFIRNESSQYGRLEV